MEWLSPLGGAIQAGAQRHRNFLSTYGLRTRRGDTRQADSALSGAPAFGQDDGDAIPLVSGESWASNPLKVLVIWF